MEAFDAGRKIPMDFQNPRLQTAGRQSPSARAESGTGEIAGVPSPDCHPGRPGNDRRLSHIRF